MIGGARIAAMAMLIAGAWQAPTGPDADYAAIVETYHAGNADTAVLRLARLDYQGLEAGFNAFFLNPKPELVAAAAAAHTEAALRRPDLTTGEATRQLRLAASIVAVGEPPKLKRLGSVALKPSAVRPVTPEFRYLWYLTVISAMQTEGRVGTADAYLEHARILFPHDPEILLLSGIAEEMRASARLQGVSASDSRTALGHAEVYLRASLELAPDRLETRLRLGRVLHLRGHGAEARELLTAVSGVSNARLSYLASLFLGGLEDGAGDPAAAARSYARATATMPSAQASRLAASELLHRAGERQQAAQAIPSAVGAANSADPWWAYLFGEYWRVDPLVNALRKMSRS